MYLDLQLRRGFALIPISFLRPDHRIITAQNILRKGAGTRRLFLRLRHGRNGEVWPWIMDAGNLTVFSCCVESVDSGDLLRKSIPVTEAIL